MSNESSDVTGAQSVDRAVTVLEILARLGEATVSEVALELGVHRSASYGVSVWRVIGSVPFASISRALSFGSPTVNGNPR